MADLLQWAKNERATGALVLRRSSREKQVFFDLGGVVGCISDDPADYFGQFLLLSGHLDEAELVEALTLCARRNRRLGEVLISDETLPLDTVQQALTRHIEDLVCDLFLWERGLFFFDPGRKLAEKLQPLPIDTMGLVLEGTRWVDELKRIRRVLRHDGFIVRRGAQELGENATPLERRIVQQVRGEPSLGKLHRAVGGSLFRFLSATYGLCMREVLDLGRGEPNEPTTTTVELDLRDLVLEQSKAEGKATTGDRPSSRVPFQLLERMVPVWVGDSEPQGEEAAFLSRCDGRYALGPLMGRDREPQLDFFLQALAAGDIALLPAPLDELEERAGERELPEEKRWWRRLF